MFDGFTLEMIDTPGARLRVRHGGSGPPVVLLHGHPRTHATWHRVAPILAAAHTVVCPDLRGFGRSSKPADTADHAGSSKRAKAQDVVDLMRALGFERFARLWWHWFFFAQPGKPERAILADPLAWYGGDRARMGEAAFADYLDAIQDPATVHAMVEDYRAGLGIDRLHDEADRAAGRRVACPTLVLWSKRDDLGLLHGDVPAVWRPWLSELRGHPLDCGHHMAEELPEVLASRLAAFLAKAGS